MMYELSEAGLARKHAMLDELKGQVIRSARRRSAVRKAGVVVATLALATFAVLAVTNPLSQRQAVPTESTLAQGTTTPAPIPANTSTTTPDPDKHNEAGSSTHSIVTIVHTQPGVTARYAVHENDPKRIDILTDEQLLDDLAKAGHPTGLIRTQGKVILTGGPIGEPTGSGQEGMRDEHNKKCPATLTSARPGIMPPCPAV
jgi:hypothetical protein